MQAKVQYPNESAAAAMADILHGSTISLEISQVCTNLSWTLKCPRISDGHISSLAFASYLGMLDTFCFRNRHATLILTPVGIALQVSCAEAVKVGAFDALWHETEGVLEHPG